jgi:hypothetical protein
MDSTTLNAIFDNLNKQIGESGLIIQTKALQFHGICQINEAEAERLLELLSTKDLVPMNEIRRMKLMTIMLYIIAEHNSEKSQIFYQKYDQWQNSNKTVLRSSCNVDHLHIVFNIIEFEDKFKLLNIERLKLILLQLTTFEKLEKPFEEYILYKYYTGVLRYLMKEYQIAKVPVMEIVIDICEEIGDKTNQLPFIDYIELKNSILNLKIMEKDTNSDNKEILSNLESLCELYNKKDDMINIKFAFKMCDVYLGFYEFDKIWMLLCQVFKKIKKQMYFGSNKFPEFIEICLNTISRIIFASVMLGKVEESMKFVKKLEKIISYVRDYEPKTSTENDSKDMLITKYHFYLLIFKSINKIGNMDKVEMNNSINNYRNVFKNQIHVEDDVIINIYSLNSSDILAKNFFDKVAMNMSIIQNNKFMPVNYLSLFFSLYNQIAILTKNVISDTNVKKQLEYIEKIRNCSKAVIEYINKYSDNKEIKYIFNFPYFKEVLTKIYSAFIYTYYFTKDYKKGLEIIGEFEIIKKKLDLASGTMIKHYVAIIKLKADFYFKMEDYTQASNNYTKVAKIYEDLNVHIPMALASFNLGLSYLYTKEYPSAKKSLTMSLNKFEMLNTIYQNQYNDKLTQINGLLDQLNSSILSGIN